jgi:CBS-domain-containing membrane protein
MDPAPLSQNEGTSIHRVYSIFRTMGLRHLPIIDGELRVVGIITRADMNEHRLHHYWTEEVTISAPRLASCHVILQLYYITWHPFDIVDL